MSMKPPEPARLDPQATEQPKTAIVAHVPEGVCIGPQTAASVAWPFELRDVQPLGPSPDHYCERCDVFDIRPHDKMLDINDPVTLAFQAGHCYGATARGGLV